MRIRYIAPFTILAVSGSLLFSGCGDKGPSEADFKKEANAACKTYNEKTKEVKAKFGAVTASTTPQELAKLFEEQEATFATLTADLQKVDAPKKQKADFNKLIDQAKSSKELVTKTKAVATSNDPAALQQIQSEGTKTQAEVKRLSSSLGLDECGKN